MRDRMPVAGSSPISIPQVRQRFGFATQAHQTLAIAWTSFHTIAASWGGLILLTVIAMLVVLSLPEHLKFMSVPLLPRTEYVLTYLTAPLTDSRTPWVIIPLLTVFYVGELVWKERKAGLSEFIDAMPVREWVLFLGKFLGLVLVLIAWLALLTTAGILAQLRMGYEDFQIGLYLQILLGIQLADYLLFAMLAFAVHTVVDQKHVGRMMTLIAYGLIAFASALGIEHNLLVYGSDLGWSYTDMRGFGPFLKPWFCFKLYWAAWALLLAVVAKLLWVRGKERGLGMRLQLARHRFTPPAVWAAGGALGLILALGGFIFYNTNVVNAYRTASDSSARLAEYERRYKRFEGIPQPSLTGTKLHVEIYPQRREVEVRGTYRLVNDSAVSIDAIHLATEVEPGEVEIDRPSTPLLEDEELGHRIYSLVAPLQPGESLRLKFAMRIEPGGFRNGGVEAAVVANGTVFWNTDWLPAIGYQPNREIRNAGERRAHGLAARPALPSPYAFEARQDAATGARRIAFDAILGTDEDQIAIAPGTLRRTWTEGGRRYFHYVSNAPIGNQYAFFSAAYAVHKGEWISPGAGSGQPVAIQIFHHPAHSTNLNRMLRSVQASLSHYTEQFGPYPYSHIRLVEHPGHGRGMHAESNTIDYQEGFSHLNPREGPRGLDLPFFVVAHEVAHQWWGHQLTPARIEGGGLLVESLASYSAYQVVEDTYGFEHLQRLLDQLRLAYQVPRTRASVPLLRANDAFLYYRKGPFALYALSRYIGRAPVNAALRRLLEQYCSEASPPPTSLDLYRELQAVTPAPFQNLLHDLFEVNAFWELKTQRAAAKQTEAGSWLVTLEVEARKVVVDLEGVETEIPIDDWVEIGVFAPAEDGTRPGQPLHLQKNRIRSGEQTITLTVPHKPARAGIDPYHLLIDWKVDDNIKEVRSEI